MSLNRVLNKLIIILVFFIPLGMSIIFTNISGSGERVGQSDVLVNGVLTTSSRQPLHVSIIDIISFGVFCLLLVAVLKNKKLLKDLISPGYVCILMYMLFGLLSLTLNKDLYSQTQLLACSLYLFKFFTVSLIYTYILYYLNNGGQLQSLIKVFILSSFIAAIIGLINPFTDWFSTFLIRDRVSYYGVLGLLMPCFFFIVFRKDSFQFQLGKFYQYIALINIELTMLAVLVAGKRGVEIAIFTAFILLAFFLNTKRKILIYILMLLTIFSVNYSNLAHQYDRTFVQKREFVWWGIGPDLGALLKDSWVSKVLPQNISYSVTGRIARALLTVDYLKNPNFNLHSIEQANLQMRYKEPIDQGNESQIKVITLGIGFWGTQYRYNYLPDSFYFQVLLETGVLGVLAVFSLFLYGYRYSSRVSSGSNGIGRIWKFATIILLLIGVTANIFYIFNLMAIFWVLSALVEFYALQRIKNHPKFMLNNEEPVKE